MSSPWIAWFKKGARSSRTTASTSSSFTRLAFRSNISLIILSAEKLLDFFRNGERQLDQPGGAVRIFVQFLRRAGEQVVDFDHLARDQRVDIADRFHRL